MKNYLKGWLEDIIGVLVVAALIFVFWWCISSGVRIEIAQSGYDVQHSSGELS